MSRPVHLSAGYWSLCSLSNRDKVNARFASHIRDVTCGACQRSLVRKRRIALRGLRAWAEDVARRYHAPVYLVGSTLTSGEPRDTDVRAVLPDDEFERRWMPVERWAAEGRTGDWTKARYAWARECTSLAAEGSRQTLPPVDFQAIPASIHATFEGAVPMLIAAPEVVA